MISPKIEPKKIFFTDVKPIVFTMLLSNHATKVIKATAKITPGIAYPEIDKVVKLFKNLLLETLFP